MLENKGQIDHTIPVPLYYQLKKVILNEIENGSYKSGDMVPTENELAEMFGLSRTTVRSAMSDLVQEGWLYRVKAKGTFVGRPKISQDFIKRLRSYNDTITDLGMTPATQVIEFRKMSAKEAGADVIEALQLSPADDTVYIFRRRFADDEPMVTVKTWLPYKECKNVLEHDLTKEQLYRVLAESPKSSVFKVERVVEAVEADEEDEKYLQIKPGKPVLLFHSTGSNAFGGIIEYSIARYAGDRNSFSVTVFPG